MEHDVLLLFESFGDLPPPHVLLPPLRPTPTILTTRLFSRYTTFFQGYVPVISRGSDFSFSTHVDCIRGRGDIEANTKLLYAIATFNQTCYIEYRVWMHQ